MTAIKTLFGTIIGFLMVVAFTGSIAATVISLAMPDKTALKAAWAELRCLAGYPIAGSDCVQDIVRAANAARSEADRARDLAEDARKAAEDALAKGNLKFEQGPAIKTGVSLVVGTIYLDVAAQSGLVRSFCWAIVDEGGLDPRVGLAVRGADGQIAVLPLSQDNLELLEMDAADLSAALAACPWPGGTP